MKIVSLQAENIKRIVAVEIRPDGNLVQITGRNGQGKSSILDALWWALAGAGVIQGEPIRRGAKTAKIRLDLGELIITRTFGRDTEGESTTRIAVTTNDGKRFAAAQTTILDGLLGAISFDPLEFASMQPGDQYDVLTRFVPGIDFAKLDKDDARDYEARRELNGWVRQARAVAASIEERIPDGLPDQAINEQEITRELAEAGRAIAAADRARRARAKRETELEAMETIRSAIPAGLAGEKASIADAHERERVAGAGRITELEGTIEELQHRIADILSAMESDAEALPNRLTAAEKSAEEREKSIATKIDELRTALDAEPLPEPPDIEAIERRLNEARAINEGIRTRGARDKQIDEAAEFERRSDELTTAMAAREKQKADAIATANLPIPGLGLGAGRVTLDGIPFEQASDAQRLRTSVAIAMAENPKLRVVRIRDGSLLDEDGMRLLAEMADAADCQVWVERVDDTGQVGFVIEDGRLKPHQQKEPDDADQ